MKYYRVIIKGGRYRPQFRMWCTLYFWASSYGIYDVVQDYRTLEEAEELIGIWRDNARNRWRRSKTEVVKNY